MAAILPNPSSWSDASNWAASQNTKTLVRVYTASDPSLDSAEIVLNKVESDPRRERLRRKLARESCYGKKFIGRKVCAF